MRSYFLLILLTFLFLAFCSHKKSQNKTEVLTESPPNIAAAQPGTVDNFSEKVKPMLARNCTPCHVPGGKMYERLPFDHAEVVRSNSASILRRLKSPDDKLILESWLLEVRQ